jgi:hypothetical protein
MHAERQTGYARRLTGVFLQILITINNLNTVHSTFYNNKNILLATSARVWSQI